MESRNDDIQFPDELFQEIGKQPSAMINLSKQSKHLHSLFSTSAELPLANECLRQLLSHAALGEWEAAEGMWKLFPDLLTCRGTVFHPNRSYVEGHAPVDISADQNPGRYKYVNLTAWQIAVVNEEYEEAEKMGACMTEEEKQTQFAEIFPDGEIKIYHWDLEEAKRLLQAVFDEVIKDPLIYENDLSKMSESTRAARSALIDYVKPKAEHKIGLVFDANLYVEALRLYEEKFSTFTNWSQRSFWNIKMEEWLAVGLGTGYLQPHAQGIGNRLKRSGCVLADNSSYFSFRRPSNSIPGSHFFVGYYGRAPDVASFGSAAPLLHHCLVRRLFTKLMSSKNESRDRLYAACCAPRSIVMSDFLK